MLKLTSGGVSKRKLIQNDFERVFHGSQFQFVFVKGVFVCSPVDGRTIFNVNYC